MIVRAILLKNLINFFVAYYQASAKDEKNLLEFILTIDDQHYCLEVLAFIKLLYLLVKELEGESAFSKQSSSYFSQYCSCNWLKLRLYSYISDVMPAYDIIKGYIKEQIQVFNSNDFLQLEDFENEKLRLQTNIMNANTKLQKYRALLTSPIYYAAVVLVPQIKWDYFENHIIKEDLLTARKATQKLWGGSYFNITVDIEDISVNVAQAQVSQLL